MSKVFLVSILSILLNSCGSDNSRETNLKIQVNVMEKLSNNLFYDKSGIYDSVRIEMSNKTDTLFRFWSLSCSWTYNWISDNEKIYLYPCDCYANYPTLHEIRPGEKISFNGIIHVLDTSRSFNEYEFKFGCIIIKENEFNRDSDFLSVLDNKISERKDVIWSEPFKIKE